MGLWCMEQRRSERCSRRTTFSLCPTFAEFFPEPGQPLTETMALNKVAVLLAFPCIQGMISGALQGRRSLSELEAQKQWVVLLSRPQSQGTRKGDQKWPLGVLVPGRLVR